MTPPVTFEMHDGYACYRPSGEVTFNLAVALIANAIARATSNGIQRLLVDSTELRGFPHPTTAERQYMAEQWAARASGVRVSFVARPDHIDPLRFGIMVARKNGLLANVFQSEAEAVEWLLHPDPE